MVGWGSGIEGSLWEGGGQGYGVIFGRVAVRYSLGGSLGGGRVLVWEEGRGE